MRVVHRQSVVAEILGSAELVRWSGQVVTNLNLLGNQVDVVARVGHTTPWGRDGELYDSAAADASPAADGSASVSGGPVLALIGVIARRRSWRTAIQVAQGYSAFCPLLAVVPQVAITGDIALWEADAAGVGLVAWGAQGPHLLVPPGPWSPPSRTEVTRLVEEIIYRAATTGSGQTIVTRTSNR